MNPAPLSPAEVVEVKDAIEAAEYQAKLRQEKMVEQITEQADKAIVAVAVSAPFLVLIIERLL